MGKFLKLPIIVVVVVVVFSFTGMDDFFQSFILSYKCQACEINPSLHHIRLSFFL